MSLYGLPKSGSISIARWHSRVASSSRPWKEYVQPRKVWASAVGQIGSTPGRARRRDPARPPSGGGRPRARGRWPGPDSRAAARPRRCYAARAVRRARRRAPGCDRRGRCRPCRARAAACRRSGVRREHLGHADDFHDPRLAHAQPAQLGQVKPGTEGRARRQRHREGQRRLDPPGQLVVPEGPLGGRPQVGQVAGILGGQAEGDRDLGGAAVEGPEVVVDGVDRGRRPPPGFTGAIRAPSPSATTLSALVMPTTIAASYHTASPPIPCSFPAAVCACTQ